MSAITAIIKRLEALEKEVTALREENSLLKMAVPLSAFTAGLQLAEPAEVKEWYALCQAKHEELCETGSEVSAEEKPVKSKKPAKEKAAKEKRAATNPEGPAAWNAFVRSTWASMIAAAGVEVPEEEKDFKAAAKTAGISYQAALQEAKIRKAAMEGREPSRKSAKAASGEPSEKKVKEPKEPKQPKEKKAPKPAKKAAEPLSEEAQAFADAGLVELLIDGEAHYVDKETREVYVKDGEFELGAKLGIWDAETETIVAAEEDDE